MAYLCSILNIALAYTQRTPLGQQELPVRRTASKISVGLMA